jgi:hypothetical protein
MRLPLKIGFCGWPTLEASTGYKWMAPTAQPVIEQAKMMASNKRSVMTWFPLIDWLLHSVSGALFDYLAPRKRIGVREQFPKKIIYWAFASSD